MEGSDDDDDDSDTIGKSHDALELLWCRERSGRWSYRTGSRARHKMSTSSQRCNSSQPATNGDNLPAGKQSEIDGNRGRLSLSLFSLLLAGKFSGASAGRLFDMTLAARSN